MMNIEEETYLTFDDVLLKPQYSEISSRNIIDISSELSKDHTLSVPIISACMDSVTELEMAIAMNDVGGMGILHRQCTVQESLKWVREFFKRRINGVLGAAVGIQGEDLDIAMGLIELGCQYICVDIAHAHYDRMKWFIGLLKNYIDKNKLKTKIIAGNVVTPEGAKFLYEAGADWIKVGIGGGSICTTRVKTGHGFPQLSAIRNCSDVVYQTSRNEIIADGGIRSSGDIVKALAAGASFVMIGNLLAGCTESSAKISEDGKFKIYQGVTANNSNYSEGVKGLIDKNDSVSHVINKLAEGIRSGLSYSGAKNIKELQEKAIFLKITSRGFDESHPHNLLSWKEKV